MGQRHLLHRLEPAPQVAAFVLVERVQHPRGLLGLLGFGVLADRLLELLQESGQVRRSRVRFVDE